MPHTTITVSAAAGTDKLNCYQARQAATVLMTIALPVILPISHITLGTKTAATAS
jgi:hypothetical protein